MYTHIQRTTLQKLFRAVSQGADPYKAADEVVDMLNANYDLKQVKQCMNCDGILDPYDQCNYCNQDVADK